MSLHTSTVAPSSRPSQSYKPALLSLSIFVDTHRGRRTVASCLAMPDARDSASGDVVRCSQSKLSFALVKDEPSSASDLGYGETRSRAVTSLGAMLKTDALAATPGDTPEFVDMLSAHGLKTDEKAMKIASRYEASLHDVDPAATTAAAQVKSQRVSPPVRQPAKSSGGHHHHASHGHGKSRPANLNLGAGGSGVGRSHLQPPQAAAGTYLHTGLPLYLGTPAIADHHRYAWQSNLIVFVDFTCQLNKLLSATFPVVSV